MSIAANSTSAVSQIRPSQFRKGMPRWRYALYAISGCKPAAIHYQDSAMAIIGSPGGQEYRSAANFRGVAPAAGRNSCDYADIARRVVLQRLRCLGAHVARRDGVHVDAPGGPFVRQQLGEARNAVFCGRV